MGCHMLELTEQMM